MRGNRVLASLTTIALLASCAPPPTRALRKPEGHPTGIAVVPSIPVESLMTHRPSDIDDDDPCGSVPPELVESEGFPDPPVLDGSAGCMWVSAEGLALTISTLDTDTMAEEVASHAHMAIETGEVKISDLAEDRRPVRGGKDPHRRRSEHLHGDRRPERPETVAMLTYLADPVTGEAIPMNASTSVRTLCPTSRKVAQNLVRHVKPWR